MNTARTSIVQFLQPTEPYGYVALYGLNKEQYLIAELKDDINAWFAKLFFWVVPFSTGVWRLLFASLTFVGIVMCLLERKFNEARGEQRFSHHSDSLLLLPPTTGLPARLLAPGATAREQR